MVCNLPHIICKFNFDRHLITLCDVVLCKIDEGFSTVKMDS